LTFNVPSLSGRGIIMQCIIAGDSSRLMPMTHAPETGTENLYRFSAGVSCESVSIFSGTKIWYGVEQCSTRFRKPWPKWRVLIGQTIASCVVCLYKLCYLLFYCFKMNWWDNSVEKLIQKFCFQLHLVRKTGTRKLVYQFSVPVSGACVFGITIELFLVALCDVWVTVWSRDVQQYKH